MIGLVPLVVSREAVAAVPCSATAYTVGSFAELQTAVGCFSAASVAGVWSIEVTADIDYTAPLLAISNTTPGLSLTIDGNGHTLDANGNGPVVFVEGAVAVTIETVTLTGGDSGLGGGLANLASGTVTVRGSGRWAPQPGVDDGRALDDLGQLGHG